MVNTNKNKQRRTVGAALLCSLCCVFSLNFGKAVRDSRTPYPYDAYTRPSTTKLASS